MEHPNSWQTLWDMFLLAPVPTLVALALLLGIVTTVTWKIVKAIYKGQVDTLEQRRLLAQEGAQKAENEAQKTLLKLEEQVKRNKELERLLATGAPKEQVTAAFERVAANTQSATTLAAGTLGAIRKVPSALLQPASGKLLDMRRVQDRHTGQWVRVYTIEEDK